MKRFVFAVLVASILTFSVSAQSGRKIAAAPKPTPATGANSDEPDFSESTPVKTRISPIRPVLTSVESAQQPSVPASTQTPPSAQAEGEVIKVETDLISIPVTVYDRNGLYVTGLQQNNFKIFEDGKEQQIAYFSTSDKPFTVILMIDTSPSTTYKIEEIRAAARSFVDQLKPEDKVLVITFDWGVHVHGDVTNDRQQIYKSIDKASFGNGTSLYDAVDVALRKRLSKIDGRKAIVLFTDGVDTTSKRTYDETLDEAEESESLIFPVYYNTFFDSRGGLGGINAGVIPNMGNIPVRGGSSGDYALGRKYLQDLADYTGGRVFRPESTPGGLNAAFEGIAEELRRQYNIGYIPQDEGKLGQRKQIKVRVDRPNVVVRNRDSYIVGSNKTPQQSAATQKSN
ncbi:MAG TPA: VWA domain-containing protein [Pyrinomonadaceae bacterium]|nr:VWA domain-containing protein [Pyrinomonadaceae bacterium]